MREDMAKIIVERPRGGGGFKTPKGSVRRWQGVPMEEWQTHEGMKRPWKGSPKWLSENLAPLRRFLQSALGRPWNEVHSEIRERINLNSALQLHIWQHVEQYVAMRVFERDGQFVNESGRALYNDFYVDPNSGILCKVVRPSRRERRRERQKPPEYIWKCYQRSQYRKLDDIWYLVLLKPVPYYSRFAWDAVFHLTLDKIPGDTLGKFYGIGGVYAYAKQQLNTKEIRELLDDNPILKKSY